MTIEADKFRRWLEPSTAADDAAPEPASTDDSECEAALVAAAQGREVCLTEGDKIVAYYQMKNGVLAEVPA